MAEQSIFTDPHFADGILRLVVNDREFLRAAAHLLAPKDFSTRGREARLVAQISLDYWERYRDAIGKSLRLECAELAREHSLPEASADRLGQYAGLLLNGHGSRVPVQAALDKVKKFKFDLRIAATMDELTQKLSTGSLSTDEFMSIARRAVAGVDYGDKAIDIFRNAELEKRIARRAQFESGRDRFPLLFIDPIDRLVRIIARRHLGLILAPWKRGKTMFFVWLALAYTLQGLNVIHFTLEDPMEEMEERFDAAVTGLPMTRLPEVPDEVRQRFKHYKRLLRSRLKVYDGSDKSMTVGAIESVIEREKVRGFIPDAVLVDYDDEIKPTKSYGGDSSRRYEFADVYRDFRSLLARQDMIGWTASQTRRDSEDVKILGGKYVAEDISKMRKCSIALAVGKGDWGKDSAFLWVAAHRYDEQYVGANIMMSRANSIFYDHDATLIKEREEAQKQAQGPTKA